MKWVTEGKKQIAQGDDGRFEIEKRRGFYYGKYIGKDANFNFPRTTKIKEMKDHMRDNFYWEE